MVYSTLMTTLFLNVDFKQGNFNPLVLLRLLHYFQNHFIGLKESVVCLYFDIAQSRASK